MKGKRREVKIYTGSLVVTNVLADCQGPGLEGTGKNINKESGKGKSVWIDIQE